MKKKLLLFSVLVLAMVFVAVTVPAFAWDPVAVEKAQALKKAGDYKAAAAVHPGRLCQAIYLWNHACSLVGKRDAGGDWAYSEKVATDARRTEALQYLGQAEDLLDAGVSDGEKCKGVDPDVLGRLIEAVRAEIQRH